ncbi:MAG: glycerol-3-phosphate acyltransferase [Halothece sp.]
MTQLPIFGNTLILLFLCSLLGAIPLIAWMTRFSTGKGLSQVGTGNISVAAAFQQGGKVTGILAVLSEALKGIAAVLLARFLFPNAPQWELVALMFLVMGRYLFTRGAGATNVTWGIVVHDPITAGILFLVSGMTYGISRDRNLIKYGVLVLFPLVIGWRYSDNLFEILAAIALSSVLAFLYYKIPDDLSQQQSNLTLNSTLDASDVGQKAATLSDLKRAGYPVAEGWVLPKGNDPKPLLDSLEPSKNNPLIVRSSAIGEDIEAASAAGQYETIANVTNLEELKAAIEQCIASYENPSAVQYRQDRGIDESSMSVLIQKQIKGQFSGVGFSRDPVSQQRDAVLVEALPGGAEKVVSGEETPEDYRVFIEKSDIEAIQGKSNHHAFWQLPEDIELEVEGEGELPPNIIKKVAFLTRHIEVHYHGIPQDIEWTYDGEKLWLLQSRPITTLLPIWTRKIAAEVIPGAIRPLTWSINQPLTCGIWGDIFTIVLKERAFGLDFDKTATLHYSRAYFNASLLGKIFERMGLPKESLEFLTRGESFSKPPLRSTLQNVPGLLRLLRRELRLEGDFKKDYESCFSPTLQALQQESTENYSDSQWLERIDTILAALQKGTYYSILVPLSVSLRKALFQVNDDEIDNSQTPEVSSLRSLQQLAKQAKPLLEDTESPLEKLSETQEGQEILHQLNQLIENYGYLSEVANDIAVPTWKEDPTPAKNLFRQFLIQLPPESTPPQEQSINAKLIQSRVNLKGHVTTTYSQLMAQLRWSFLGLAQQWEDNGMLSHSDDIFFLKDSEIRQIINGENTERINEIFKSIEERRSQLQEDQQLQQVPPIVYGNSPPPPTSIKRERPSGKQLQGIGASPGQVQGQIKVVRDWQSLPEIDRNTILAVPYTDSGWAPILARAGGLISEVGGRLSHGAIVAREYGIPAVMDIDNATQQLQDGQQVYLDGQRGIVQILD